MRSAGAGDADDVVGDWDETDGRRMLTMLMTIINVAIVQVYIHICSRAC